MTFEELKHVATSLKNKLKHSFLPVILQNFSKSFFTEHFGGTVSTILTTWIDTSCSCDILEDSKTLKRLYAFSSSKHLKPFGVIVLLVFCLALYLTFYVAMYWLADYNLPKVMEYRHWRKPQDSFLSTFHSNFEQAGVYRVVWFWRQINFSF